MKLYASRSLAPEGLLRGATGSSGQLQLMFFDSDNCPDWADALDRLTIYNSQIMVCVVNSDYSTAARLVNNRSMRDIADCIRPAHDSLERSYLDTLTHLNHHVSSTDEFLIVHGNRQEARLPLSSICYIETVKGTHICNMHCSDEEYAFRSNIKELSEKLGPPFCQVQASTTVNLSNVRFFKPNPGILSFTGGVSYCCSRSYKHDLSDCFRGHPGHVCAKRGGG